MSSEPEHRGRCRLTLTINVVRFSVRQVPSEDDQMQRALRFILLLLIAAAVGAADLPHHGGKSANPSWLYSWARPRTVVVSQRPPAPGTTDALTPLELAGTPVLRTWQRGAIHFRWTPDGIVTQGFLDFHGSRSWPTWTTGRKPPRGVSSPRCCQAHGCSTMLSGASSSVWPASCWASSPALLAIVEYGAWALVVPPRPRLAPDDVFERPAKPPAIRWTNPGRSRPLPLTA